MDTKKQEAYMEAILGPDSQPFEIFISHLIENRSEANSMLRMIKQKDPDSFALKLAKSLGSCNDGEALVGYINRLHSMFLDTLNDSLVNLDVKITALKAMISFIQRVGSSKDRERLQDLLPPMMNMLTKALDDKWEAPAQSELEILIELAKNEPSFFRMQLVDVVGFMFDTAKCKTFEKKTRQLAVEFVMTLVEAREKAPGMIKKYPLFTERYFAILLNLLEDDVYDPLLPDPDNVWESRDDLVFVNMCFWRLSNALGGKTVGPVAFEQLRAYLDHDSWQKPCAAVTALSQIVKGCSEVMIKNMKLAVTMVLDGAGHPHPGVRFASMLAINEFSRFLRPHFQEQCHHQILPALTKAMDDDSFRVQVRAMLAVQNFICLSKPDYSMPAWSFNSFRTPEYLIPYVRGIHNKLLQLSSHTVMVVQKVASHLLKVLFKLFKECFGKNYNSSSPLLETTLLKQSNVEMINSAYKAGSPEVAKQIMEAVIASEGTEEEEDTRTIFKLQAISGFCEGIGKGFLPCTSIVMPLLFQCAQLELDTTILSADSDNTYLDDNSIHKVKLGDSTVCIKKSSLTKKALACEVLVMLVLTLKEDFYPWIFQTASVLLPLLKFYFKNEIRKNAVIAIKNLLQSAKLAVKKGIAPGGSDPNFKHFLDIILLNLVGALHEEPETKIYIYMLDTLHVCLQTCGPLLNEGQLRLVVDEIKHVIKESSNRKRKLTETEKTEDFDAEEAKLLRVEKEQEDQIFASVGQILHILIKTFKVVFLPFFDELSLYLIPMWGKEMTIQEKFISLYMFDGLVSECSEAALKYCDVFLPLFLDASNDENPTVRQNALYGLGLYAEYDHGSVFKPFVREAISRINVVIMHIRAREPENELAYDNAVSTLGKICQFHREHIDSAQVIPIWLNCLPIKGDLYEAKYVHGELCSMVGRSDRELLGPKYEHFPKIMSVFAEVVCAGKYLATEETANCMIDLLRKLQKEVPPATLSSAWSLLLPRQEMKLKSFLLPDEDY